MNAAVPRGRLFHRAIMLAKSNFVTVIAAFAAAVTCVFVPLDEKYIGYFDFKTLSCLFCVLAVVCALKNENFFYALARGAVRVFGNARSAVIAVVYITFIGSMLIANDMALITFLPLGYFVLSSTGKQRYMPFTFIMQNIAANLGGMLTPFGNPQNLYLYTKFDIPAVEFVQIMLLPFCLSVALITLSCVICVKNEPIQISGGEIKLRRGHIALYLVLFALSIVIVFHAVPYIFGLIAVISVLLFADRKALKTVDYGLLLTFCFFFIFSGNMARIDAVRDFFSQLLGQSTLLVSILSCQFISNVPTAVLLSQFTSNYPQLLVGVNIGGIGTLISSLASLITLREYIKHDPHGVGGYIAKFSAFNFAFLIILTFIMAIVYR